MLRIEQHTQELFTASMCLCVGLHARVCVCLSVCMYVCVMLNPVRLAKSGLA